MKTLIILDIDNTLAENKQREHLLPNWEAFFKACDTDTPIEEIIKAVEPFFESDKFDVYFVTGRTGYPEVKDKTQNWLDEHLPTRKVFYRPLKDYRKSHIYKESVLNQITTDKNQNILIIDDDPKIIEHFKSLGHKGILIDKNKYYENVDDITNTFNLILNENHNKNKLKK